MRIGGAYCEETKGADIADSVRCWQVEVFKVSASVEGGAR